MSFKDAALSQTQPRSTVASEIAQTEDGNLTDDARKFKVLMRTNDANVAAAEQALALSKKTPTDHWWAAIESFQRKLDAAKQVRDDSIQECNEHFKDVAWKPPFSFATHADDTFIKSI